MKTMKHICNIMAAGILAGMSVVACTKNFESYNTNPAAATQQQMQGDNSLTVSLIKDMIHTLADGQQNNSQMIDQMIGSEYGGHGACVAGWGNAGNFYTYNPRTGWIGVPFDTMMPQIYTGYFKISEYTGGKGLTYAWAQVIRIASTLRLSDIYGPVPYSKVSGGEYKVAYDNLPDLYGYMFEDLDKAIETIYAAAGEDTSSLAEADYVYGGDFTKWVKFANTLKLRMAMRLTNANPALAKAKAEEAVAHPGGLLSEAGDCAWSTYNDGMNPYYRAAYTWNGGEIRVSANVTSYLGGYRDPRLDVYATKVNGEYVGVRNGIDHNAYSTASHQNLSNFNFTESTPLLVMSAAESWFLRAEGALYGWSMNTTVLDAYKKGIEVSMEERGVKPGDYFTASAVPAAYVCNINSAENASAASSADRVMKSSDSQNAKLEKILIQKWIASFPNGWERWADFRRTGYPKMLPVYNNLNTDGVSSDKGMRRIPYPQSEYNTNNDNVNAAVAMLGGADTGATNLWWAK